MKKAILILVAVFIVGGGVFALTNIGKETETIDQSNTPAAEPAASPDSPTDNPAVSSASTLKQGEFMDADGFHKGSGTAQVMKTNEGNIVKFSSDFSVTNGPDLFVYFSKTADENDKDPGDFVSLGKLQKTSGEQTYKLPDNLDGYKSVVIWCRAFKTTFSVAPLK